MSADLFKLIHSMSTAEKRYFTTNATKGGDRDSNYLLLFDVLNSMDDYDDEKLVKKLNRKKKESIVKFLAQERQKLQKNILSSMRNFHMDSSPITQLKGLIMDANYLRKKGLYKKCESIIKKAKKIAEKYEQHLALIEIHEIEKHLTLNLKHKDFDKKMDQLIIETKSSIALLTTELDSKYISHQLSAKALERTRYIDAAKREKLIEEFTPNLALLSGKASTNYAVYKQHYSNALLHLLVGKLDIALENFQKTIDWWEDNHIYKEIYRYEYISNLFDFINVSFRVSEWAKRIPILIKKLEESIPDSREGRILTYIRLPNIKLRYYLYQKEFTAAKKLIRSLNIDQHNIHLQSKLTLIANIVSTYFLSKDYEDCIVWVDKIIQAHYTNSRADIQIFVRLLNIIAHYELNKIDKLDDIYRAAIRYLKKHTNLQKDDFYYAVLEHLKKIFFSPIGNRKNKFSDFNTYLIDLEDNSDKIGIGWGELKAWVKTKN